MFEDLFASLYTGVLKSGTTTLCPVVVPAVISTLLGLEPG